MTKQERARQRAADQIRRIALLANKSEGEVMKVLHIDPETLKQQRDKPALPHKFSMAY